MIIKYSASEKIDNEPCGHIRKTGIGITGYALETTKSKG
jgi:hypothetical protein